MKIRVKEVEFYESQLLDLEKKMNTVGEKKDEIKKKAEVYEAKVQQLIQKRKDVFEESFNKAMEIIKSNLILLKIY